LKLMNEKQGIILSLLVFILINLLFDFKLAD